MIQWIEISLAEITTLLLAIAAVAGLYLSYLFRPSKIEVEKRHSDDLKEVIDQWKKEIMNFTSTNGLDRNNCFEFKYDEKYDFDLVIESEYYFDDLKNHIPFELNLMKEWYRFKKNWCEYEEKRYEFFLVITTDISKKIDLPWSIYANWEDSPSFSNGLLDKVYTALSDILRARKQNQDYFLSIVGKIMMLNNKYYFISGVHLFWDYSEEEIKKKEDLYYDYMRTLQNSPFLDLLKNLQNQNKRLIDERNEIIKKLNYLDFIPLLPGKCKYIKWSLPGLIEKIKNLFR